MTLLLSLGPYPTHELQRQAVALLLEQHFGHPATVRHNEKGAPFLEERPDLCLSLSHCREAVAVALSESPVGVDVEAPRTPSEGLLKRCFSDEEQVLVAASPQPALEFCRLWTRKEAYLKWLGTGILGLDHLRQVPPPEARISSQPLPSGLGWLSLCG